MKKKVAVNNVATTPPKAPDCATEWITTGRMHTEEIASEISDGKAMSRNLPPVA